MGLLISVKVLIIFGADRTDTVNKDYRVEHLAIKEPEYVLGELEESKQR